MRKVFARLLAIVLIFASSSLLWAQGTKQSEVKPSSETGQAAEKPKMEKGRLLKLHATVEAVNKANKTVTLKGPEGNVLVLPVENPRNLEAVKVGDLVSVEYYEAVAVEVMKQEEAALGTKVEQSRVSSQPGERPGGELRNEVTVVATIESIDRKNNTVTLLGPEGKKETVAVQDPKKLEKVAVGDRVAIKVIEALAVSLVKDK